MLKELKVKWVKALRSGKYHQGKGKLKKKNGNGKTYYCCLGVLRELDPMIKGIGNQVLSIEDENYCKINFVIQNHLVGMNDGRLDSPRFNFKEIATWIEKNQ